VSINACLDPFNTKGNTIMATKRQVIFEALHHRGALGKAVSNEPVFVLRAQDQLAADCVEKWAMLAELVGVNPDKIRDARDIVKAMREWPNRKVPD
jgi:hypothetical protein